MSWLRVLCLAVMVAIAAPIAVDSITGTPDGVAQAQEVRWSSTALSGIYYRWGGGNGGILYIKSTHSSWKAVEYYDGDRWRRKLVAPNSDHSSDPLPDRPIRKWRWGKL